MEDELEKMKKLLARERTEKRALQKEVAKLRARLIQLSPADDLHVQTPERIIAAVCKQFGIKPHELIGTSRVQMLAMPRHIAAFLCRTKLGLSLAEIGEAFNGRDHTTILESVRKVQRTLAEAPQGYMASVIREIENSLETKEDEHGCAPVEASRVSGG